MYEAEALGDMELLVLSCDVVGDHVVLEDITLLVQLSITPKGIEKMKTTFD